MLLVSAEDDAFSVCGLHLLVTPELTLFGHVPVKKENDDKKYRGHHGILR
jgi:hypothetical protein